MANSKQSVRAPHLLEQGERYTFERPLAQGGPLELRCVELQQRNWSRVGIGETIGASETTERFFLKQSVDRGGEWIERLFRSDAEGAELARKLLDGTVHVPRVVVSVSDDYLNVFAFRDMITPDALLRQDRGAFQRLFPGALDAMDRVLRKLASPAPDLTTDLSPKAREYGRGSTAINFKGFEIRNSAFGLDPVSGEPTSEIVLFDFGHPYLAPIEEACAKLLVSVGLLNWGRPLSRFLRGPMTALMDVATERLSSYVDRDALRAEIELQRRFRSMEFKAAGRLPSLAKQAVIQTVGKRYLNRLDDWCERLG